MKQFLTLTCAYYGTPVYVLPDKITALQEVEPAGSPKGTSLLISGNMLRVKESPETIIQMIEDLLNA